MGISINGGYPQSSSISRWDFHLKETSHFEDPPWLWKLPYVYLEVVFSEVEYQIPPSKWLPIFSHHSPTVHQTSLFKDVHVKHQGSPKHVKSYQIIYSQKKIAVSKAFMLFVHVYVLFILFPLVFLPSFSRHF